MVLEQRRRPLLALSRARGMPAARKDVNSATSSTIIRPLRRRCERRSRVSVTTGRAGLRRP